MSVCIVILYTLLWITKLQKLEIFFKMNCEGLVETTRGSIKILRFNRPHRKNALDKDVYIHVTNILNNAAVNDAVSMIVITGTGDFYSSGNDLSQPTQGNAIDILINILQNFVEAFIKFPKPIIAIVNGPAVGIAVTTLALCDFVFAVENAYFYTPFIKLGLVPEGCSTYLFPKLIGERKAMEMLLLNKKMSAEDALAYGFVNNVWKCEEFERKAWERVEEIATLYLDVVIKTKKLIRNAHMQYLLEANKQEMNELKMINDQKKSKL